MTPRRSLNPVKNAVAALPTKTTSIGRLRNFCESARAPRGAARSNVNKEWDPGEEAHHNQEAKNTCDKKNWSMVGSMILPSQLTV